MAMDAEAPSKSALYIRSAARLSRPGRQNDRLQGRRPSQRRAHPEHELLYQRRRREDARKVIASGRSRRYGDLTRPRIIARGTRSPDRVPVNRSPATNWAGGRQSLYVRRFSGRPAADAIVCDGAHYVLGVPHCRGQHLSGRNAVVPFARERTQAEARKSRDRYLDKQKLLELAPTLARRAKNRPRRSWQ